MSGERLRGTLAVLVACGLWGLSALYWGLVAHVPALEVLAHRTLWSFVFFGAFLLAQRRGRDLGALLRGPGRGWVLAASLAVAANWFFYVWSVSNGYALEASLGYYIFPLVAVFLGMVVFGERLTWRMAAAIGLAVAAVVILTYGLGVAPYIALILAGTFGVYGMLKKRIEAEPMVSVTAEVTLLAPLALGWLIGVHLGWFPGGIGAFGGNFQDSFVLAFAGVFTGLPLVLFAYGAQRLPLGQVGVLQYINPTLQFFIAVWVLGETATGWHLGALTLIWVAVAIYSLEALRADRGQGRNR
ncbi:MAG: protein RarD [Rhodobacterales bacterium]|nr:MAG: protein RarD [Rhodobacterales bacterium]